MQFRCHQRRIELVEMDDKDDGSRKTWGRKLGRENSSAMHNYEKEHRKLKNELS